MDRTRKILLSELAGSCLLTVLLVAVYETGLLLPGGWAGADSGIVVTLQFLMQFLTLSVIPLALFLFRTGLVRRDLRNGGQQVSRRLLFWGSVRMMLICVPMVLNLFFYYAFGDLAGFFYLAVILALSLFFIYPGRKRCMHECHLDNPEEEDK